MRFRGTLAARVALLAAVAVALSVAGVAVAAYVTVQHQLIASLDHSLLARAHTAARVSQAVEMDPTTVPPWFLGATGVRIAFLRADGGVVENTPPGQTAISPSAAEMEVARGRVPSSVRTAYADGVRYRVAAVPGTMPGTALVLEQSLAPIEDALGRLGLMLTIFGLLGVVGAGIAGWAVARNGLRPVRRLSDAVEEIARTEKLDPIAVEGNDEVARLAVAFNTMLAALEASQRRQRQLVADAGHELRTPLTSLRTNLDLLTQAESRGGLSEQSRTELMDDLRFQIHELTTLIGDLTELARDDPAPSRLEPVDLADVVGRAVERVRRRATVSFDLELQPWLVTGEAVSLERAVTNLLDNAAKWSPEHGVVTVRLEKGTLYVADQGPGISPDDLPHVFDRFYRSVESRTMPGSGLGLSIVRAVAERHGGAVLAGAAPEGGAAFWFRIPGGPVVPTPSGTGSDTSGTSGASGSPDTSESPSRLSVATQHHSSPLDT
ncbi:MAG: two-component system, OmpR family, sensor histidine kinase MprB [Nocardioidaceae bacterium]|nr:two-component system, OmpR family, sensor histidine kinase MprB [Nocardioidaceae bacterium]